MKAILKHAVNVGFSLTMPLFSVLLLGYALNYYWQIELFAMAVYAFSLSYAVSCFNKNCVYRSVVAFLIFFFAFLVPNIMAPLQLIFFTAWAALFSHSSNVGTWCKYKWLIVPHSILRIVVSWMIIYFIPFRVTSCVLMNKNVSGLLGHTYTLIIAILLLDLLANNMIIRFAVKKKVVDVYASA